MCSEKERYVRIIQKRVSPYECNDLGEMIPEIAIKEYSRSAADQVMEKIFLYKNVYAYMFIYSIFIFLYLCFNDKITIAIHIF